MKNINDFLKEHAQDSFDEKVKIFNTITEELYKFIEIQHPVLNVHLVKSSDVEENDYNPNKVAPPEMKLLELSIRKDGLTMPVVVARNVEKDKYVIVDGFHRNVHCKHTKDIKESLNSYIPVSFLDKSVEDRITSTVRHNIARGSHQVELTAKLVGLLKKHNWTNEKIGEELGMDPDEILRLKQITGLAELFNDKEFSKGWEVNEQK